MKNIVFRLPRFLYALFLVLLGTTFCTLGCAGYMTCIKNSSIHSQMIKEVVGDYIVSPIDITQNQKTPEGAIGMLPTSSVVEINGAERIANELNGMAGIKAMAVGCKRSHYVMFVKEPSAKLMESWYKNRKFSELEYSFKMKGFEFHVLSSRAAGDFTDDVIYGIDSRNLLNFYDGEDSFEFYGLTGKVGAFFSEALAESLGLQDGTTSVTMLVSDDRSQTVFNGTAIEVPVAGFFRIPIKEYSVIESDWKDRLGYNPETEFIFLDMDYYDEVSKISAPSLFDTLGDVSSLEIIAQLGQDISVAETSLGAQNIWVRGGELISLRDSVSHWDNELRIEDSIESSFKVSRLVAIASAATELGRILFCITAFIVFFIFSAVLKRILDQMELDIRLFYISGSTRGQVFRLMSFCVLVPTIPISIVSYVVGLAVVKGNMYLNYLIVPVTSAVYNTLPWFLTVELLGLCIGAYVVWNYVRTSTLNMMRGESLV